MKIYDSKKVNYIINNIVNKKDKQELFEGRDIPYEKLSDREFEILSYCIFKRKKIDKIKEYDNINLMQGVGEKGRDCVLYKNGEVRAIIQCKHTEKNNRMDRPSVSKEVLKFVLNCLKEKSLIPKRGQIEYYLVHSFGFNEPAQNLLNNFYSEITKDEGMLKELTEKVIKKYSNLSDLKYECIHDEMLSILKRINIYKYERQDIDLLLSEEADIISLFFKVKLVVEKGLSLPREYELSEPSNQEIKDIYTGYNFIHKLTEIKIKMPERIQAIKDYWSTIQTLELLSNIEYFDEKVILAYEKDLLTKYRNKYNICCEGINSTSREEEMRSKSRIFYWDVINQNPIKIIGISDNRPFFQSGVYHDLANTEEIPTWMLKLIEEAEDDEDINNFL